MQPLNLNKILILKSSFWAQLAIYVIKWIRKDMLAGKVQLLTGKAFYNRQYAKYKLNFMNRFTTRTYKKGTKNIPAGTTLRAGTKLLSVIPHSASVRSNSQTPNLYLTGTLINGLKYKGSFNNQMAMGYDDKDADKILYNEALGRDIRTLSEENTEKARIKIEDEFGRNIKDFERGRIVIEIGRG